MSRAEVAYHLGLTNHGVQLIEQRALAKLRRLPQELLRELLEHWRAE